MAVVKSFLLREVRKNGAEFRGAEFRGQFIDCRSLFGLLPGFRGPQFSAKQAFQMGHKRHIAQRTTCLLMFADVVYFSGRYSFRQEIRPAALDDRKQGSYIYQFIILTGYTA
jgi:hypothetical protein